jgi:two-component system, response regulator PdtaR
MPQTSTIHEGLKSANKPAKRIIIVDDEMLTGLGYASTLADAGYHILGITDRAPEAVRAAQQHRPDLVIMDISLHTRFDGIRAAREIQRTVGTPILFVSAHSDSETLERAAEVGPVAHLAKPVAANEFVRAVDKATRSVSRLH